MYKRWTTLALALMLALCCAQALADAYKNVINPMENRGITPLGRNAQGGFDTNPVISGESATTGLPFSGNYWPTLVSIDNNPAARPQWGVRYADILYELPIQGNTATRLMGLYSDQYGEQVGPVRSIRILHVDLRESWDCALVFWGMQTMKGTSVEQTFRDYGVRRYSGQVIVFDGTDGQNKPWKKLYTATKNHASPHNKGADIGELAALAASSGYEFKERPFLFTDELPETGAAASKIDINYSGEESYSSGFAYDAETNAYKRFTAGQPHVDLDAPDEQLAFQNVIIQRTEVDFYYGTSTRPLVTEVGEGNADIFMGGRYIAGYWARTGLEERTVFFDAEGNELALQRGKTYIMITSEKTVVSYE